MKSDIIKSNLFYLFLFAVPIILHVIFIGFESPTWKWALIVLAASSLLVLIVGLTKTKLKFVIMPKSLWVFSHFLTFLIAALVAPQYSLLLFSAGVLWEWFECHAWCWKTNACNDLYDILANAAGIALGLGIRQFV